MAGMIAASGASANNEDAKALPIVNRPEVPVVHAPSWGTPPDVFGRWYAGSSLKRKNDIRRKHNAKYHK